MEIQKHEHCWKITQAIDNKLYEFTVTDLGIDPTQEHKFRIISKCRAGYMVVSEMTTTLERAVTRWKRGALQTVEIEHTYADGYTGWVTVLVMKNNRFFRADRQVLELLKVGDIHYTFPKMADLNHWQRIGSTTHNCPAYGDLEKWATDPWHVIVA